MKLETSDLCDGDESQKLVEDQTEESVAEERLPSKAKQIAMLATIVFLMVCSLCLDTMMLPFFPAIAVEKGLSSTEIGIVFASYELSKFITSPIFGSLLVKWPPKSMCAVGNILTAVACIALGVADIVNESKLFLLLCLLLRLAAGVGSAMLTVSATSLLMKSTSYQPSTIGGIIDGVMPALGCAFGPVLGAAAFDLLGYTGMFCLLGGVILVFIPVYMLVIPNVVEKKSDDKKRFISLLTIPGCLVVFFHCLVVCISITAVSTGISEYMTGTFGASASTVGLMFGIYFAALLVFSSITTRFIDRRYTFHMMTVGMILTAVIDLFIGPSPLLDFIFHGDKYFWLTSGSIIVMKVVQPLLITTTYQAALDVAEANGHEKGSIHTYGMIAGLINSGYCLGGTAGPILSGAITDALSFPLTLTFTALCCLIMGIVMATYMFYMRCTHQPLYLPRESETKEESTNLQTNQNEVIQQKINDACTDRMNKCLENIGSFTEMYEQQPTIEDCY